MVNYDNFQRLKWPKNLELRYKYNFWKPLLLLPLKKMFVLLILDYYILIIYRIHIFKSN